jgi:hypothetical protein
MALFVAAILPKPALMHVQGRAAPSLTPTLVNASLAKYAKTGVAAMVFKLVIMLPSCPL